MDELSLAWTVGDSGSAAMIATVMMAGGKAKRIGVGQAFGCSGLRDGLALGADNLYLAALMLLQGVAVALC